MKQGLKHATLLSDRHHGFAAALRHWRTQGNRAVGRLADCNEPKQPVVPRLLERVRNDEVVLSVDGQYWRVSLSERGRIVDALRQERPLWLDDPLRFHIAD